MPKGFGILGALAGALCLLRSLWYWPGGHEGTVGEWALALGVIALLTGMCYALGWVVGYALQQIVRGGKKSPT